MSVIDTKTKAQLRRSLAYERARIFDLKRDFDVLRQDAIAVLKCALAFIEDDACRHDSKKSEQRRVIVRFIARAAISRGGK